MTKSNCVTQCETDLRLKSSTTLCIWSKSVMSAYTLLNTTARGNQPFTQVTQSWCSKQCFSPLRNSVRRECKVVCDSTVKQLPAGRWKQASSHGSQVADQPVLGAELQTAQRRGSSAPLLAVALCVGNILLQSAPAIAFTIHQEPENALSFPTWVIHISSVIEWAIAMSLVWKYAEVTGNAKWKGLTWGMMPLLGGALCACTYHFFYNSSDLDFLVAVQASLTWIGNATCAAAAYRIYKSAQQEGAA